MAFQRKKPEAIGAKAPYPGFIEPELATAVDKVPSGKRWIHEIKFDGYRVQVHLRERRGQGLHSTRQRLDQSLSEDRGRCLARQRRFGDHRRRGRGGGRKWHHGFFGLASRSKKIALVAFDLLYLNGHDLRKLPLVERKALLKKLIDKPGIQFSESFQVDGREMRKPA